MKSARELAIADVTITLTDAVRGNFVDDESLAAIAVDLVEQIEQRYLDRGRAEPAAELKVTKAPASDAFVAAVEGLEEELTEEVREATGRDDVVAYFARPSLSPEVAPRRFMITETGPTMLPVTDCEPGIHVWPTAAEPGNRCQCGQREWREP